MPQRWSARVSQRLGARVRSSSSATPRSTSRRRDPPRPLLAFGPLEHEKRVLPNGVRVLVSEMPEARSASLAVFVGAGSRMEDRSSAGTGHFLEHIVFKGTAKRPTAADISQEVLCAIAHAIRDRKYDRRKGSFRGWLFTILRNTQHNWRVRQARRPADH